MYESKHHGFARFTYLVLILVIILWFISEYIVDQKIKQNKNQAKAVPVVPDTIVKYSHPRCGACIKLQPVWDQFAPLSMSQYGVPTRDVNCQATPDQCIGIEYFPTIKTQLTQKEFKMPRTLENLESFAQQVKANTFSQ